MSSPLTNRPDTLSRPAPTARNPRQGASHNEALDPVDREAFLHAMSHTVSGVNVVTTDGPGGRFGLTVSAMTSLSADPPMLLVCIHRQSPLCAATHANHRFGVNVLADCQSHVSGTFSGHPERGVAYAFAPHDWDRNRPVSPRLRGAVAHFDCDLEATHDFGSHTLFVGRVRATTGDGGTPLLYSKRTYGHPHLWTHAA